MLKLSLMIPTIVTRQTFFDRLLKCLNDQAGPFVPMNESGETFIRLQSERFPIEIVAFRDNGEMTIGAKRNLIVGAARGEYLAFIDDDDLVAPNYIAKILVALDNNPDTVGFKLLRMVNGVRADLAIHSLRYDKWGEHREGGKILYYERTPNHLNPTRAELVRQVEYKDKSWGEDSDYSARLRPLLKSECFIDRELYIYLYREQNQRTGEVTNRGPVGPTKTVPVATVKHVPQKSPAETMAPAKYERPPKQTPNPENRIVPIAKVKYKRPKGSALRGKY